MNGKVEYNSPLNHRPLYKLIHFEGPQIYAVEMIEMMVVFDSHFTDDSREPGDTSCALFALTKEEFALKDRDINALDQVIDNLYNRIPEDRLIEAYYLSFSKDTHAAQKKPMKLRPLCKTMDDYAYQKHFQNIYIDPKNQALDFLNSAKNIYMIYDKETTDLLPAITCDGCADIFTRRQYAEDLINKESGIDTLAIKEFQKEEFDQQVKTWHAFGITKFYLNAGTPNHACLFKLDDYMPDPVIEESEYNGSSLRMYFLRYRQYRRYRDPNMKALAQTLFSAFCYEIEKVLFLCPFVYDNESYPLGEPDYALHMTSEGEKFIKENLEEYDEPEFYGGENYQMVDASDVRLEEINLFFLNGTGDVSESKGLPAFTDFASLHAVFGENVRVALCTYDELCAVAQKKGANHDLLINPNALTMQISQSDMEAIEQIRKESVKLSINEEKKPAKKSIFEKIRKIFK
mgnify:CR=1 FL=1